MRQVNQHLYDMDRQLHEQMADICEKLVREPKPSFVDDYEVRGVLGFSFDNKDSVLAFVKDLCYPVFDLLHVNDFWSEVEVAYQHFTQIKNHSPEKH